MSLLSLENFAGLSNLGTKYLLDGSPTINTNAAYVRSGSQSVLISKSTHWLRLPIAGSPRTGVIGFAYYTTGSGWKTGSYTYGFLKFSGGGNDQVALNQTADGAIKIYRYNSGLKASAPAVLKSGRWHYIEVKFSIANSIAADSFIVRVDGQVVLTLDAGTDTQYGGDYADQIRFSSLYYDKSIYLDDIYICDLTGTVNNDFLGPIKVENLVPTGNGNYSQLTGSDGNSVDNYLLVDEMPFADADYVEAATVGNRDSYALGNLAGTPTTIHGVSLDVDWLKDDVGAKSGALFVRQSAADYDGSAIVLSESTDEKSEIWEQDPATAAAWIAAGVNSMEAGVKVQA